jgi:phosphatidyl-myo-inositol dimannoside synthase
MKSLLISGIYYPPEVGGISQTMRSIASSLGPREVCCFTGIADRSPSVRQKVGEVNVYRRPAAFGEAKHHRAIPFSAAILEIMLRERPRIVQLATSDDGYLGLWLKRWLGLPFVVYAHGNEILQAVRNDWAKPLAALRQADRILANSRYTARLVAAAGVDPKRIAVTYLGCDVEQYRPVPPNPELGRRLLGDRYGSKVILTVGNAVERKGHDMVIRALPRVREHVPDVTYLIVGDGRDRRRLETLVAEMGLADCVVFAGRVADAKLSDVYALCDVFAMPSRENLGECDVEGFGLVFLEANACGKPVVGGLSGGIPEAVDDGVTGLLSQANDPASIAAALVRLLTNPELAARMGEQGRARVVRSFTWQRTADQVRDVVRSVLGGDEKAERILAPASSQNIL